MRRVLLLFIAAVWSIAAAVWLLERRCTVDIPVRREDATDA